jgi:hypothetical protein
MPLHQAGIGVAHRPLGERAKKEKPRILVDLICRTRKPTTMTARTRLMKTNAE